MEDLRKTPEDPWKTPGRPGRPLEDPWKTSGRPRKTPGRPAEDPGRPPEELRKTRKTPEPIKGALVTLFRESCELSCVEIRESFANEAS